MQRLSLWILSGLVIIALCAPGVQAQGFRQGPQRPWHDHWERRQPYGYHWHAPYRPYRRHWHESHLYHERMRQGRGDRHPQQEHRGHEHRAGRHQESTPEHLDRHQRWPGWRMGHDHWHGRW